jgi:hypothetical protein
MTRRTLLSIYVPQDKLGQRPVERIAKLAEQRNRSVNYLVMAAILEYLDREEPLISSSSQESVFIRTPPTRPRPPGRGPVKNRAEASRQLQRQHALTGHTDAESEMLVRAAAREVADKIRTGMETSEVRWHGPNVAHVVMRRVFLPELGARLNLEEYRSRVRAELVAILEASGWESQPQNRFVRRGFAEEWRESKTQPRRSTAVTRSKAGRLPKQKSSPETVSALLSLGLLVFGVCLFISGLESGNPSGGITGGIVSVAVGVFNLLRPRSPTPGR